MSCTSALLSLHVDYIGGDTANYKKWYFAAIANDEVEWKRKMDAYTSEEYTSQIGLYLLIWGEANNVRFIPECLCYVYYTACEYASPEGTEFDFLNRVITPLYEFLKQQNENETDHSKRIGYDDMNQLFWFPQGLKTIKLYDSTFLYEKSNAYTYLDKVDWNATFSKTYYEKRTSMHAVTNFNRIWIIHITMFWYYTIFNSPTLYTPNYNQIEDTQPNLQTQMNMVAFGGTISCLISLLGVMYEGIFVPRWAGSDPILIRLIWLLMLLLINGSTIIPFSKYKVAISTIKLVVSILTFLYLSIIPPSMVFKFGSKRLNPFTNSFARLNKRSQIFSYLFWVFVFAAKFTESYFFLTLSLRDPIRVLSIMHMECSNFACYHQAKFALGLLYLVNFILFFLDTYLWYIIFNCLFSIGLSFKLGISIFTPWRNIFARLPERISTKLVYHGKEPQDISIGIPECVTKIWSYIVISLYQEHLLTIEQTDRLSSQNFFVNQDDTNEYFPAGKEAQRRISFFALSLSIPLPDPVPTLAMPGFTVLIPHYSEKIILNLNEVIGSRGLRMTLLEYLKELYPEEWGVFVNDSKVYLNMSPFEEGDESPKDAKQYEIASPSTMDIPFNYLGFKSSAPSLTLRTRLWASLRTQTLYRTVSGFMYYHSAIQLLHSVEAGESDYEALHGLAQRKFSMLIAMQRYQNFSPEELEDTHFLLQTYPTIRIAYLEEEVTENGINYYSALLTSGGDKLKIKLSGNPILGDGKSDNQNNAIIFYRGEYIQVIDSNQDNYLEECLKIKTVLAEFEEMDLDPSREYSSLSQKRNIVAILGSREYIFSESVGILGDIAAGKEQTFGTLFSRTLSELGGKLHYGHPDFLHGIFMTTRGGLSKAQKGLHLNEDIYAGMMVLSRGGRIKHCDYYQCGKGRDLGFSTILNFTIKIGSGLGEQILSREYFYLGTQLPIDRFLTFYYAHAGFHINNFFIMMGVNCFVLFLVFFAAMSNKKVVCEYNKHAPITDILTPAGCYDLQPVNAWITRFILSVMICFFISFIPLVVQELIEKGLTKAAYRLAAHFISCAPIFEVFVCQIYAASLREDFLFGGAKYIATGRGFATTRISFWSLYSRYSEVSVYTGIGILLAVLYSCLTIFQPALIWFSITIILLCFAPFIFNPHQFDFAEFFLDYREYLRWMLRSGDFSWNGSLRKKVERCSFMEVVVSMVVVGIYLAGYLIIEDSYHVIILGFGPYVFYYVILVSFGAVSLLIGWIPGMATIIKVVVYSFATLYNLLNLVLLFSGGVAKGTYGLLFLFALHNLIHKVVFICLTRDSTSVSNVSWWSGKWLFQGLGWSVLSQPFREIFLKIVEVNQFTHDLLIGHFLLFTLLPFLFIPYIDRWHSVMLFWLKPGLPRPIWNERIRNKRYLEVFKYGVLFFTLLLCGVVFILGALYWGRFVDGYVKLSQEYVMFLLSNLV